MSCPPTTIPIGTEWMTWWFDTINACNISVQSLKARWNCLFCKYSWRRFSPLTMAVEHPIVQATGHGSKVHFRFPVFDTMQSLERGVVGFWVKGTPNSNTRMEYNPPALAQQCSLNWAGTRDHMMGYLAILVLSPNANVLSTIVYTHRSPAGQTFHLSCKVQMSCKVMKVFLL